MKDLEEELRKASHTDALGRAAWCDWLMEQGRDPEAAAARLRCVADLKGRTLKECKQVDAETLLMVLDSGEECTFFYEHD